MVVVRVKIYNAIYGRLVFLTFVSFPEQTLNPFAPGELGQSASQTPTLRH